MTSFAGNFDVTRPVKTVFQTLQEKTIQDTYRGIKYHYAERLAQNSQPTTPYTLCYRGVKIGVNPATQQSPVAQEPKVYALTYRGTRYLVTR